MTIDLTRSHLFNLGKRISSFRRKSTFHRIWVVYILFLWLFNGSLSLNIGFCLGFVCGLFLLLGGCLLFFDGCSCSSLGGSGFLLLLGFDKGSHSHAQRFVGLAHVRIQR
jgi:hypothetical protein